MRALSVCVIVLCAAALSAGAVWERNRNGSETVASGLVGGAEVRPVTLYVERTPYPSRTPDAAASTPAPEITQAPVFVKAALAVAKRAPTPPPTPKATPKPTPKPTPKLTPKPTPKPTAKPTSPPTSREQVKAQIRQAWDGNDDKAIAVADCESGLNPRASSPSGINLGLWQFTKKTWHDYGGPGDDPRDSSAATQTSVAWRVYQQKGWSPWPGCA
jgi:outer membrane biosynthesis protein TonB